MTDQSLKRTGHSHVLYRSDTILVRQATASLAERWVITFDHHGIGEGFDRFGFSEQFLLANDISAIHVLGRGNDWYQYDDAFDAMAAVRIATAGATRRITYGSSMGGYAAIRFADAVGADGVLALSPQWSINPTRASWEDRWSQDSYRIKWLEKIEHSSRCRAKPVLVYDPHLLRDWTHAKHIAAETPSELVPVPYSNHPTTTLLAEIGMLRPIVQDVLNNCFDRETFVRAIRARRSESAVYLGALAERQPDARPRTALALALAARVAEPSNLLGMLSMARTLTRIGHHSAAVELHQEIVTNSGRLSIYLVPLAEALLKANNKSDAISIAAEVTEKSPDISHLRNWRADLLWKVGERSKAVDEQRNAVALDLNNLQYRRKLNRYRIRKFRWQTKQLIRSLLSMGSYWQ